MNTANAVNPPAKILSGLCTFVVVCILVAGLWPFHVPRNAVSRLKNENGLHFSKHSAAVSAGPFRAVGRPDETGFSLEISLSLARTNGGGTILAFDSSPDPRAPFKLSQFGSGVALQRYSIDEQGKVHHFWFKVPQVFEANKRAVLVITSNKDRTDLYLNGVLAGTSPDPGIASRELTGRLVLGNSTYDDTWNGEIQGLAIYREELTAAQVSSHFQRWTSDQNLSSSGESLLALYRFDERQGSTIHNQIDPATDLIMPDRYFVLHKTFLTQDLYPQKLATWKHWSPWANLGINVGGFVPVGFVFYAYFSSEKRSSRAALVVILVGFLLSLLIEVSQWFLPNRDSGMADLFTNTSGTAIGVLLYRWLPVRVLWTWSLEHMTSVLEGSVAKCTSRNTLSTEGEKLDAFQIET